MPKHSVGQLLPRASVYPGPGSQGEPQGWQGRDLTSHLTTPGKKRGGGWGGEGRAAPRPEHLTTI